MRAMPPRAYSTQYSRTVQLALAAHVHGMHVHGMLQSSY
eukprot:COSAG01_NODE_1391_length_10493_cov_8.057245_5_plen_39_part_00